MDCTVDSMLTTTPFFRPRDGCEPIPTISSWPSSRTSPTSATTLDVPMSRPTIILPLCTVDIAVSFSSIHGALTGDPCARTGIRQPGDRQAVGMAQVDARDVRNLLFQGLVMDGQETPHLLHDVVPTNQQFDALPAVAGLQRGEPAAPLAQFQSGDRSEERRVGQASRTRVAPKPSEH